eukprot:CAMPEP_0195059222 /NCGR_PEP_ID=MMETSP0448-20130528/6761_1 /TAXON_ID=66468 /ORGANISM="Heterocapsa triquestra, Strain CCMP 448" /LENGTH=287 /DNA_ID=CAMNT_0040089449 /DNA_START=47 /DNA_END=910 /DNA_ORIENTATION=+
MTAADVPCQPWDADRFQPIGKLRHCAELYRDLVLDKDVVVTRFCANNSKIVKIEQERDGLKWSNSVSALQTSDGEVMLLAATCKPEADLWKYSQALGLPGPEREAHAMQVLRGLISEVRCLHAHGIAHGNLCLEAVLVASAEGSVEDAALKVSLTDFQFAKQGQEVLSAKGPSGKPMYVAPEAHQYGVYDARDADFFACGVLAYALMVGEYPFMNTAPGQDKAFSYLCERGSRALLEKRTCHTAHSAKKVRVVDCMSGNYAKLTSLLLSQKPSERVNALDLLAESTN